MDHLINIGFYLIIVFSSFVSGEFLVNKSKIQLNKLLNIPIGFAFFISIITILSYLFVFLKLPSVFFFYIILILLLSPLVILYKNIYKLKEISYFEFLIFLILLISLVYITYNRALGEENFDTLHYLSMIIETAKSNFLTERTADGLILNSFNPTDSLQGFYYFLASLYYFIQKIKLNIQLDIISLTNVNVIWITSVILFTSSISIVLSSIDLLKVKNRIIQIVIILFTLLYFGTFYYNTIFAFYGNSFRTVYAGLLSLIIYKFIYDNEISLNKSILLMLISFSLMGFSSTGYFISFVSLYALTIFIIKNNSTNYEIDNIFIYFIPTLLFVTMILYTQIIGKIALALPVLYFFLYIISKIYPNIINKIFKIIIFIVIPSIITVVSFYLLLNNKINISFFVDGSFGDMAWGYFRFDEKIHIITNSILWLSLLIYLLSKNKFKYIFIIIFLLFLNPINYAFLVEFLMNHVFYRTFDAIFNLFTLTLIISTSLSIIDFKNFINIAILLLVIYLANYSIQNNYHYYFNAEEDFDNYNRLRMDEANIYKVLNTKINIEKYDQAKIISSTPTVKGFVSNIYSIITVNEYRQLERYTGNTNPAPSELWNIFVKRSYYGEPIFNTEPDYDHVCQYLIEERVDFVILDNSQFYEKDGVYVPLYFEVRGCATFIYENDSYMLYQFYWD